MLFNGGSLYEIDEIDEETFTDICVMYSDGVLGNRAIYDALTPLTSGVFNYMRDPAKSPAFDSSKLFPWVNEYEKNPDFEPAKQDKASESLLLFMTTAPGFDMGIIKNGSSRTV